MLRNHELPRGITARTADLIAYFITEYDGDPPLTDQKLHAFMYLAERQHREKHGVRLTSLDYIKHVNGPANTRISDTLAALINADHIHETSQNEAGRPRTHYVPCCKHCARNTDTELTEKETETADTVLKRHRNRRSHELAAVLRKIDAVEQADKYTRIPLP